MRWRAIAQLIALEAEVDAGEEVKAEVEVEAEVRLIALELALLAKGREGYKDVEEGAEMEVEVRVELELSSTISILS